MKHIKLFENFWGNHSDWMKYTYLDLEILENGDMKIILNENGKEETEDGLDEDMNYDLFDDIRANSELLYFSDMSDTGFGMSSAPCITDGYYVGDDGDLEEGNKAIVYWYPNYLVKSFTDELVENGYVIFQTGTPKTKEEIEKTPAGIYWNVI